MSSIKGHLGNILEETTKLLDEHTTSADEFIAVDEIEKAVTDIQLLVHKARKTFERTKRIDEEPSDLHKG
jgi:hypothetical protein